MKASFRDKYIEICENTLQSPSKGLVSGVLLSHLKLNAGTVIQSCKDEEKEENNDKKQPKKKNSLERKGCVRNSDGRSRTVKERSIKTFERRISHENVSLVTHDGYLIPEEVKQQILQARQTSLDAKSGQVEGEFTDENQNSLGTFISISYRNSRKHINVDTKEPIHKYCEVKHRHSSQVDGTEESPYSVVGEELREKVGSLPKYYIIDDGEDEYCMHKIKIHECWQCETVYSDLSSASSGAASDTSSIKEAYGDSKTGWLPSVYLKKTVEGQDSHVLSDVYLKQTARQQDSGFSESSDEMGDRFYFCLEEIREEQTPENKKEGEIFV